MRSLPQIAKSLNVSISTLRYRIAPYESFLPNIPNGKGCDYNEATEGIIGDINRYCIEKKSQEEIIQILSGSFTREIEVISTNKATTNQQQPNNEIISIMQDLVAKLDRQDNLQQQINEMKMAISEMSKPSKRWYDIFK